MSLTIDTRFRQTDRPANRHRAHSLHPDPGREAATAATAVTATAEAAPLWADEETWDDEDLYAPAAVPDPQPTPFSAPSAAPFAGPPVQAERAAESTTPNRPRTSPTGDPHLPVPPRRTVAPFPTIRAGGGRHRLPTAVRRRPGPIAAGLMVAATTLAAGSLRLSAPLASQTAARTAHQCAPVRPGETCG